MAQVVTGTVPADEAPILSRAWAIARALLTDDWQRRVDLVALVAAITPCAEKTAEGLLIEAVRLGAIESTYQTTDRRRVLLRRPQREDTP